MNSQKLYVNQMTEQLHRKGIENWYPDSSITLDSEDGLQYIKQCQRSYYEIKRPFHWAQVPLNRAYDTNFHNQNALSSFRHEEFSSCYLSISDCYYHYALYEAAKTGGNLHNGLTLKIELKNKSGHLIRPLTYLGIVCESNSHFLSMGSRWRHVWRVLDFPSIKMTELCTGSRIQCNAQSLCYWSLDIDDDTGYSIPWNSRYDCLTIDGPFKPSFMIKFPIPIPIPSRWLQSNLHLTNPMLKSITTAPIILVLFDLLSIDELFTFRRALVETNETICHYAVLHIIRQIEKHILKKCTYHECHPPRQLSTSTDIIIKVWFPITLVAQMHVDDSPWTTYEDCFQHKSRFTHLDVSIKHHNGNKRILIRSGESFITFDRSFNNITKLNNVQQQHPEQPNILNENPFMLIYTCYQSTLSSECLHPSGLFKIKAKIYEGVQRVWQYSLRHLSSADSIQEKFKCKSNLPDIKYPDHILNHPRPIVEYIANSRDD